MSWFYHSNQANLLKTQKKLISFAITDLRSLYNDPVFYLQFVLYFSVKLIKRYFLSNKMINRSN